MKNTLCSVGGATVRCSDPANCGACAYFLGKGDVYWVCSRCITDQEVGRALQNFSYGTCTICRRETLTLIPIIHRE